MLAWFGGIAVDLREVELAPGARLSLHTLFGGIAIKTPPSWRVESELKLSLVGSTPDSWRRRTSCTGADCHGNGAFRRDRHRSEGGRQGLASRRD